MGSQVLTLSFPLTNVMTRQIFEYNTGNSDITMMYDSGAQIPVWCTGSAVLLDAYPKALKTDLLCTISGFGREKDVGKIYVLPEFILSSGENTMVIDNLYIAELFKPFIGCDFLISETMFSKADTTTLRRGKRELLITFYDLSRHLQCTPKKQGKELTDIAIWSQAK